MTPIDDGDIGFVTIEKYNQLKMERDRYREALEKIRELKPSYDYGDVAGAIEIAREALHPQPEQGK